MKLQGAKNMNSFVFGAVGKINNWNWNFLNFNKKIEILFECELKNEIKSLMPSYYFISTCLIISVYYIVTYGLQSIV